MLIRRTWKRNGKWNDMSIHDAVENLWSNMIVEEKRKAGRAGAQPRLTKQEIMERLAGGDTLETKLATFRMADTESIGIK